MEGWVGLRSRVLEPPPPKLPPTAGELIGSSWAGRASGERERTAGAGFEEAADGPGPRTVARRSEAAPLVLRPGVEIAPEDQRRGDQQGSGDGEHDPERGEVDVVSGG